MEAGSDKYYIEKVLAGNVNAFYCLIEAHKDKVFNLAFRICGNREEAEEIAQDAFLKAYRSLSDFRMKSSFATWLYRIVYNTAISLVRTRKDKLLSLDEFPTDALDFLSSTDNEDEAATEYKNVLINFALQKIPEDERGLITLYYYNELPADEISRITGISKANLKVKLFRARQKMAGIIRQAEMKNVFLI